MAERESSAGRIVNVTGGLVAPENCLSLALSRSAGACPPLLGARVKVDVLHPIRT